MSKSRLHVVAGVLERDARYLIQQRPEGKTLAGYWEFPGGKVESGESAWAALVRELDEELDIEATRGEPLIQLTHAYPDRTVFLDVWRVSDWHREPRSQESQVMGWHSLQSMNSMPLLPADGPILQAMSLPHKVLVTPLVSASSDDLGEFVDRLQSTVHRHDLRLCILRQPRLPAEHYLDLARRVKEALAATHCDLVLHGAPADRRQVLAELRIDRLHVPARYLSQIDGQHDHLRLSASCHDQAELYAAIRVGAEFALLGSVRSTPSHPGGKVLGWHAFRDVVSATNLPVYAIGGMRVEDEVRSRLEGAQGIAAISAWWP